MAGTAQKRNGMLSNQSVNHIELRITLKLSGIHADRSFPKADDIAESIVRSFSGDRRRG